MTIANAKRCGNRFIVAPSKGRLTRRKISIHFRWAEVRQANVQPGNVKPANVCLAPVAVLTTRAQSPRWPRACAPNPASSPPIGGKMRSGIEWPVVLATRPEEIQASMPHEELLQEFETRAIAAEGLNSFLQHISQRLHEELTRYNWVGFYFMEAPAYRCARARPLRWQLHA